MTRRHAIGTHPALMRNRIREPQQAARFSTLKSLRAGSSRGKRIRTRATDEQSCTSIGSPSCPRTLGEEIGIGFFRVTRSPGGSCPVPSYVGSRERGESNSSQPKLSSVVQYRSQFVTKNQIRPVNEAGRAVGFIPVTPCSLGKRQPERQGQGSRSEVRPGSAAFSLAANPTARRPSRLSAMG